MHTRTFGWKLAVGFGVVVGLTLAMGVVAWVMLDRVTAEKDRTLNRAMLVLPEVEGVRSDAYAKVAAVRGFLLTGAELYATRIADASARQLAAIPRVQAAELSAAARASLDALAQAVREHDTAVDAIVTARRGGDSTETLLQRFADDVVPRFETLGERVDALLKTERADLRAAADTASQTAAGASQLVAALALLALLGAAGIGTLLVRQLNRQVGGSVQQVRSASAELQAASTQQASGAREQASAMGEISTTIGELLTTARQIAESAEHVARVAEETAAHGRSGTGAVEGARSAVERIRSQVGVIVDHMLDLGRKSQRIGGILEVINELAEQTNILAVNATIEAADAGDAGRRFSVVGEEIRKLADRVGGSTREIRTLIDEMRAAVNTTVMATEAGSKTVEGGAERFADVATAFARISEHVDTTSEVVREIVLSTKQQSSAVEQVNEAIRNVAQATRETEVSTVQTQQTATELSRLSDDLSRLVHAGAAG